MPAPSQPLVLSPKTCEGHTWQPPQDLGFARHRSLIPLHAGELAKAVTTMPLAIIKQGDNWQLVGVSGNEPGHNLFIKQGKWLGHYQPEWLSTYPFEIVRRGQKHVVAFDQDSGLLGDKEEATDAEPLFDEQGEMTPAVTRRVEALKANHRKHQTTHKALSALADAGVLAPWPERLKQQMRLAIDGLYLVDEKALSQLDGEAFLALRQAQALPIVYSVNLSLPQAHLLARLSRVNPAQQQAPENLDGLFGEGDDDLTFDFS